MIGQRWCRVVFVLAAALAAAAGGVGAQGGWSAQLVVSPLPSPYLSDWEIDPTIGELIVTNSSASTTDAMLHYALTRTQRIRTAGALPFAVALADTAEPPVHQRIARKALQLHELGLSDRAIAKRLGVTDKTVAKGIRWLRSRGP